MEHDVRAFHFAGRHGLARGIVDDLILAQGSHLKNIEINKYTTMIIAPFYNTNTIFTANAATRVVRHSYTEQLATTHA
jgi:hypothetical protein